MRSSESLTVLLFEWRAWRLLEDVVVESGIIWPIRESGPNSIVA